MGACVGSYDWGIINEGGTRGETGTRGSGDVRDLVERLFGK